MVIERFEVVHFTLPFERLYTTARGSLTERDLVLLKLHSEGLTGLGETAAMTLRGSKPAGELARELDEACREHLLGVEIDASGLERALIPLRHADARPELLACADIALHDLLAQAAGVPLWHFLGCEQVRPIRCNATLPMANPSELANVTAEWRDVGFDTFKLKVGVPGDTARVAAVRRVVGEAGSLRLDANGAWRPDEAAERLAGIGESGIELIEEPTSGLGALSDLRTVTDVPIAADESVATGREAREAVERRSCDYVALKLAKVGGIRNAIEIAETIPSYMTSALEGPVGVTAAAHVVGAMPDSGLPHGLATERLFSSTVGRGGEWMGADLILPEAPGIGVVLDDEMLENRRVR